MLDQIGSSNAVGIGRSGKKKVLYVHTILDAIMKLAWRQDDPAFDDARLIFFGRHGKCDVAGIAAKRQASHWRPPAALEQSAYCL